MLMEKLPIYLGGRKGGLECVTNIVDELIKVDRIRGFAAKHICIRRHNSKFMTWEMREGNLVLRQVVLFTQ